MDFQPRAPISSPDDDHVLPRDSSPSLFASICGHFFGFGFAGQIIYTVLQLLVASGTLGHQKAEDSMDVQLALFGLPLACSVLGVVWSCKWPMRALAHPGAIVGYIMLLGLFNLVVLVLTGFAGYC